MTTRSAPSSASRLLRAALFALLAPCTRSHACYREDVVPSAWDPTWRLAGCTSLDLSCADMGRPVPRCANALLPDEVTPLAEALQSGAPALKSLELRGSWIGPLGADRLAKALREHAAIESLGLGSTALGEIGGASLARKLLLQDFPPALRRLDLSHNHLGDDFARALADVLKSEDGAPVEAVDLSWNAIGKNGGRYLGDALRVNEALLELTLRWNGLQDRGARAMGEALGLNRVLSVLDLEHNAIKDAGGKALAAGLRNNTSLRKLALEHNGLSHGMRETVAAALRAQPELPPRPSRQPKAAAEPAVYTKPDDGEDDEVEEISFDDEDEPKQEL